MWREGDGRNSDAGDGRVLHTGAVPGTKEDVEESWAAVAAGQAGAVTYRQLRKTLTDAEIRTLLRRGIIRPTAARGVFRVAGAPQGWTQDLWIALLAGPDGTAASHLSAAALWGLIAPPATQHVTVRRGASGRFGGAVVHHSVLTPADLARRDRIETTAVARTIVDCAAVLNQKGLNSLVDAAFGKRLSAHKWVMDAWQRAAPVRGRALLEAALEPYADGAGPGSVKAAHVLRLISDLGLPLPECEYEIKDTDGGFLARVDFIWRPWWLILEYDGDESHSPRRWPIDDATQARIERLGYRLERADRFDLRPSSARLRTLLADILLQPARGPWPPRPYSDLARPA